MTVVAMADSGYRANFTVAVERIRADVLDESFEPDRARVWTVPAPAAIASSEPYMRPRCPPSSRTIEAWMPGTRATEPRSDGSRVARSREPQPRRRRTRRASGYHDVESTCLESAWSRHFFRQLPKSASAPTVGCVQGLLRKLADLDSDAERGVRLIDFFDQLAIHGADLEAIVRATAVLAEATVGAVDNRVELTYVVEPDGTVGATPVPPSSARTTDVRVDDVTVGRVWLDRNGVSFDWDELILSRMALTVAAAQTHRRSTSLGLADPAILQVLLDPNATEVDTSRSVRLLGFVPGELTDVVALSATTNLPQTLGRCRAQLASRHKRRIAGTALTDRLGILVLAAGTLTPDDFPTDVRACIGPRVPIERLASAWNQTRQGVRFAAINEWWAPCLRLEQIGTLALLADVPEETARQSGDVRAVQQVWDRKNGDLDLRLLEAFCASASIREAASALHMHHSSAAYRLDKTEAHLGFPIREAQGRLRLYTALIMWRLHGRRNTRTPASSHRLRQPMKHEPP